MPRPKLSDCGHPQARKLREILVNHGYIEDAGEDRPAARDLLTDLLHFCEQNGLKFEELLEGAHAVFIEEHNPHDLYVVPDDTDLYWSNAEGWVNLGSATLFTRHETNTLRLPMGGEGWMKLTTAERRAHCCDDECRNNGCRKT